MSRWTDEELRELVTLWPTNSASQIAKRLHRLRSAICGKAVRLRQEGLLPHNPAQHFDVYPSKRRPPGPKPPPPSVDDSLFAVRNPRDRLSRCHRPSAWKGQRSCPGDQCDRNRTPDRHRHQSPNDLTTPVAGSRGDAYGCSNDALWVQSIPN